MNRSMRFLTCGRRCPSGAETRSRGYQERRSGRRRGYSTGERIAAYEELFDAEIFVGNTRQIIPELNKVVSIYPFHEVFRAQLMLALYASGRQAEALQNYAFIWRRLRDKLGIEPGQDLQELHRSILEQVPVSQIRPASWS
jgi:DNA-binding SARP family transcriptional activator